MKLRQINSLFFQKVHYFFVDVSLYNYQNCCSIACNVQYIEIIVNACQLKQFLFYFIYSCSLKTIHLNDPLIINMSIGIVESSIFFTFYYNILLWDKYGITKYQIEPDVYLNMFIIEFYWCLETLLPWHKPWLLQYPSFHPTLTHQRSHTKLLLWDQALLQNSE